MCPVESSSLRNEGKSEAETSCPNSPAGEVFEIQWHKDLDFCRRIKTAWSCSLWICRLRPISLKSERTGGGFSGSTNSWTAVAATPRTLAPTWYLQEVLNEADVVLGLRWQLLEAPCSLGAAAPAGQRLVLHRHSRQNVHIRCDRSTLVGTSKHYWSGSRKKHPNWKKMPHRMEANVDLHLMLLSYIYPPLS